MHNIKRTKKMIDAMTHDDEYFWDNKKLSLLRTVPYQNIQSVVVPKILDYQTEVNASSPVRQAIKC